MSRELLNNVTQTRGKYLRPGLVIHGIVTELGDAHLDQPYRILSQVKTSRFPLFICENPAGYQVSFSPFAAVEYLTTTHNPQSTNHGGQQ